MCIRDSYDVVRWYRLLYEIKGSQPNTPKDWWELTGIWFIINNHSLPEWKEFKNLNASTIKATYASLKAHRAIKESIPDWLDELGQAALSDGWSPTLSALNKTAPLVIRTNMLKTSRTDLQRLLASKEILTKKYGEEALILSKRTNLFRQPSFKQGFFEVQDGGSQQIAPFLQVEPGMLVIDTCAGAGGKTLHLAALMKNKGRILALDIHEWKLKELRKRAKRAGIDIIETRPIINQKVIKRLKGKADRLLLDVPCSGLGVLKRNPDAKWKLDPTFLDRIKKTQQKILQSYPSMLKPNGLLVYATCSILPSENQEQVHHFIEENKGTFTLLEEQHILPQEGFDGFYMALIRKEE